MKKLFASLLLSLSLVAPAETVIQENPTQVTFQRASQGNGTYIATSEVCYLTGCTTGPAWPGYNYAGGYLFALWATQRAPGTQTMWGTWTFQSNGLFTTNPSAHVAFLMRGVSTGSYNVGGAGYTVGGLSGFANSSPCPGISGAPETWWALDTGTSSNITWGGSACSPQLADNHPYTLTMQATATGFAWWLADDVSGKQISNGYEDNSSSPSLPMISNATGTTVGIVFADAPGTSWSFAVTNMAFGWF